MRKTKQVLTLSEDGKRISAFILDRYGTVKNASEILGVPYLTLCRNCRKPTGGWKYLDAIIGPLLQQIEDAKQQRDYSREQLTHVTRLYNDLVTRLQDNSTEEIL